jgi:REP element-mobilizing transposase RayT
MIDDKDKHRRRAIRLRGYDYAQAGAYFVTIVTQDRACLFGEVVNGEMQLNDAGRMIEQWWFELNRKFSQVETDEFVVMPNHFHGTVVIAGDPVGADLRVGPDSEGAHVDGEGTHAGVPLPTIVQWFKTMTTNSYIRGVKMLGWTPFAGRLWQRNYYEHVVRGEKEMNSIREYIANNPLQWELDRENPSRTIVKSAGKSEPWEV